MGEIIIKKVVKREKGFLYYIDGEGNLCQAELTRGRKRGQKNKIIKLRGDDRYF